MKKGKLGKRFSVTVYGAYGKAFGSRNALVDPSYAIVDPTGKINIPFVTKDEKRLEILFSYSKVQIGGIGYDNEPDGSVMEGVGVQLPHTSITVQERVRPELIREAEKIVKANLRNGIAY